MIPAVTLMLSCGAGTIQSVLAQESAPVQEASQEPAPVQEASPAPSQEASPAPVQQASPAQQQESAQPQAPSREDAYTDVAVLSTTDMHGKCWETNVLTGSAETANMLRVSGAVSSIREEYGSENVILVDNGDLFQGTPVSEVQLIHNASWASDEPPVMALCLKEIGYDAFVLGNHEFNYPWNIMSRTYDYLEDNGVSVLAADVYYDGTDGVHEDGENVLKPYLVREITVDGNSHRIGILGLENTDITRWDLPANYPGMKFSYSEDEGFAISKVVERYISRMREEGCEFIIISYHSGLGENKQELTFGKNTESQGLRLIEETEGLGLVILGHDHSNGYSGQEYPDRTGSPVPVVNGGGRQLTKTVFRFSEDSEGNLTWDMLDTENLGLENFDVDENLQEKVRPYAELAMEELAKPIGVAEGDWDQSTDYYITQTDTIDLIHMAQLAITSQRMEEKYSEEGKVPGIEGLDHLDVDMSITTVLVNGRYVVKPGNISINDIYRLYRFSNNLLVLPLTGRQIRSIMEENAQDHITTRVYGGNVYNYTNGDNSTNLMFGGLNFTYDMSKPEGERVMIRDFYNGRPFEEDWIYLVAVSNYILGNERCGLRDYSVEDTVWSQPEEDTDETVQDIIAQYIMECCEEDGTFISDAPWEWTISYSADPDDLPEIEAGIAAKQVSYPEEGCTYMIYHEASGNTPTEEVVNAGLGAAACEAYSDALLEPVSQDALRFTVQEAEDNRFFIQSEDGRYLTCGSGGGLVLSEEPSEDDLSLWELLPAEGGWYIISAGAGNGEDRLLALEYYGGRFTTYWLDYTGIYIFNFYEIS